ncbi:dynein assembly factor 5, axonemal, partial [Paramuricea clavata]
TSSSCIICVYWLYNACASKVQHILQDRTILQVFQRFVTEIRYSQFNMLFVLLSMLGQQKSDVWMRGANIETDCYENVFFISVDETKELHRDIYVLLKFMVRSARELMKQREISAAAIWFVHCHDNTPMNILEIHVKNNIAIRAGEMGIFINIFPRNQQYDTLLPIPPESCKYSCLLAKTIPDQFYYQAESLVKPLLLSIAHQHSKVRLAVLETVGVVIQGGDGKNVDSVLPHIAQRTFDENPVVRSMVSTVVGGWLLDLRNRYSYFHKLLPLLLTACLMIYKRSKRNHQICLTRYLVLQISASGRHWGWDQTATIRVTNLSEDTRELDLQELFRPFGRISRIHLAKDIKSPTNPRDSLSSIFVRREDAARAIKCVSGLGYDHLILNVEWGSLMSIEKNSSRFDSAKTDCQTPHRFSLEHSTRLFVINVIVLKWRVRLRLHPSLEVRVGVKLGEVIAYNRFAITIDYWLQRAERKYSNFLVIQLYMLYGVYKKDETYLLCFICFEVVISECELEDQKWPRKNIKSFCSLSYTSSFEKKILLLSSQVTGPALFPLKKPPKHVRKARWLYSAVECKVMQSKD